MRFPFILSPIADCPVVTVCPMRMASISVTEGSMMMSFASTATAAPAGMKSEVNVADVPCTTNTTFFPSNWVAERVTGKEMLYTPSVVISERFVIVLKSFRAFT